MTCAIVRRRCLPLALVPPPLRCCVCKPRRARPAFAAAARCVACLCASMGLLLTPCALPLVGVGVGVGSGSNFVPVKQYDSGDGVFFQWVMCAAIWFVGLLVQLIRDTYVFEPFAALGGVLWCTGNMCSVPVIRCIGMGLGLLVWGCANLIMGWATGAFGLFGLDKNTVNEPGLNYAGFAIALFSMTIFFFVKSGDDAPKSSGPSVLDPAVHVSVDDHHVAAKKDDLDVALEADAAMLDNDLSHPLAGTKVASKSVFDKLSPAQKRLLGFALAVGSGIFYGTNFNPPQYLIDHAKKGEQVFGRLHSTESLDYVYSHFSGIFMASTFYLAVYCVYMRNQPVINQQLVLPSFVSGALWAVAQVMWFVANAELEFVVSFPIITTGPGVVAALWGVLKFGEIKGSRNIMVLVAACIVTIIGVILIALSKTL